MAAPRDLRYRIAANVAYQAYEDNASIPTDSVQRVCAVTFVRGIHFKAGASTWEELLESPTAGNLLCKFMEQYNHARGRARAVRSGGRRGTHPRTNFRLVLETLFAPVTEPAVPARHLADSDTVPEAQTRVSTTNGTVYGYRLHCFDLTPPTRWSTRPANAGASANASDNDDDSDVMDVSEIEEETGNDAPAPAPAAAAPPAVPGAAAPAAAAAAPRRGPPITAASRLLVLGLEPALIASRNMLKTWEARMRAISAIRRFNYTGEERAARMSLSIQRAHIQVTDAGAYYNRILVPHFTADPACTVTEMDRLGPFPVETDAAAHGFYESHTSLQLAANLRGDAMVDSRMSLSDPQHPHNPYVYLAKEPALAYFSAGLVGEQRDLGSYYAIDEYAADLADLDTPLNERDDLRLHAWRHMQIPDSAFVGFPYASSVYVINPQVAHTDVFCSLPLPHVLGSVMQFDHDGMYAQAFRPTTSELVPFLNAQESSIYRASANPEADCRNLLDRALARQVNLIKSALRDQAAAATAVQYSGQNVRDLQMPFSHHDFHLLYAEGRGHWSRIATRADATRSFNAPNVAMASSSATRHHLSPDFTRGFVMQHGEDISKDNPVWDKLQRMDVTRRLYYKNIRLFRALDDHFKAVTRDDARTRRRARNARVTRIHKGAMARNLARGKTPAEAKAAARAAVATRVPAEGPTEGFWERSDYRQARWELTTELMHEFARVYAECEDFSASALRARNYFFNVLTPEERVINTRIGVMGRTFTNMIVWILNFLEDTHRVSRLHAVALLVYMVSRDHCHFKQNPKDPKLNILLTGQGDVGKSFILDVARRASIPSVADGVSYSSAKSEHTDGIYDDKCKIYNELPGSFLRASTAEQGNEAGTLLKESMTSGKAVAERPHFDKETGKSSKVTTEASTQSMFIAATNMPLAWADKNLLTRLMVIPITKAQYSLKEGEAAVDKESGAPFSDPGKDEAVCREHHVVHFFYFFQELAYRSGVFGGVDVNTMGCTMMVNQILNRLNVEFGVSTSSVRRRGFVMDLARNFTLYYASWVTNATRIYELAYPTQEACAPYRALRTEAEVQGFLDAGEMPPWTCDVALWLTEPFAVVAKDQVILALDLTKFLWKSTHSPRIMEIAGFYINKLEFGITSEECRFATKDAPGSAAAAVNNAYNNNNNNNNNVANQVIDHDYIVIESVNRMGAAEQISKAYGDYAPSKEDVYTCIKNMSEIYMEEHPLEVTPDGNGLQYDYTRSKHNNQCVVYERIRKNNRQIWQTRFYVPYVLKLARRPLSSIGIKVRSEPPDPGPGNAPAIVHPTEQEINEAIVTATQDAVDNNVTPEELVTIQTRTLRSWRGRRTRAIEARDRAARMPAAGPAGPVVRNELGQVLRTVPTGSSEISAIPFKTVAEVDALSKDLFRKHAYAGSLSSDMMACIVSVLETGVLEKYGVDLATERGIYEHFQTEYGYSPLTQYITSETPPAIKMDVTEAVAKRYGKEIRFHPMFRVLPLQRRPNPNYISQTNFTMARVSSVAMRSDVSVDELGNVQLDDSMAAAYAASAVIAGNKEDPDYSFAKYHLKRLGHPKFPFRAPWNVMGYRDMPINYPVFTALVLYRIARIDDAAAGGVARKMMEYPADDIRGYVKDYVTRVRPVELQDYSQTTSIDDMLRVKNAYNANSNPFFQDFGAASDILASNVPSVGTYAEAQPQRSLVRPRTSARALDAIRAAKRRRVAAVADMSMSRRPSSVPSSAMDIDGEEEEHPAGIPSRFHQAAIYSQ